MLLVAELRVSVFFLLYLVNIALEMTVIGGSISRHRGGFNCKGPKTSIKGVPAFQMLGVINFFKLFKGVSIVST